MTKTVLLTGAAGSVGAHMLHLLLTDTDWKIIITDSCKNEHKGYFDRITAVREWYPEFSRVESFQHDLTAPFSKREVAKLRDVDYIINLASLSDVQDSIDNPVPFATNNTLIVLHMLELAREIKPEKFIQFSTDEVYGPADINIPGHKEWSTILPSNVYSASKAAQEAFAIAYWRSYDVPVIITNTMNQFGQLQSASKYPVKIQKAIEHGEEITVHCSSTGSIGSRYYIHSGSSAESVIFILENIDAIHHVPGEIDRPERLNIVGDQRIDNLELAEMIAKLMDKPLLYRLENFHSSNPGHDLHYALDGQKMADYGFKPSKSIEECMSETIAWQQDHPEWIQ